MSAASHSRPIGRNRAWRFTIGLLLVSAAHGNLPDNWAPSMPNIGPIRRYAPPPSHPYAHYVPAPQPSPGDAAYQSANAAFARQDWPAAVAYYEQALNYFPNNPTILKYLDEAEFELAAQRATAVNARGLGAFAQGDWKTAIGFFQQAEELWPGNQVIGQNLRSALKNEQDAERGRQIGRDANQLVRQLSAADPGAGLDFDGGGGDAAAEDGGGLDRSAFAPSQAAGDDRQPSLADQAFADANVVDARRVSSGLPKSIEDSIPHTPAGDRVRKGFACISDEGGHDWVAAQAWFKDALLHDPGNAELQRLVDLARYTLNRRIEAHSLPFATGSGPIQPAPNADRDRQQVNDFIARTHEDEDLRLLFQGSGPPPAPPGPWAKFGQWLDTVLPKQQEAKPDRTTPTAGAVRD